MSAPGYRTVNFDSCFNCKYYGQSQTIEQGYCNKHQDERKFGIDVTYGFEHICDDHRRPGIADSIKSDQALMDQYHQLVPE